MRNSEKACAWIAWFIARIEKSSRFLAGPALTAKKPLTCFLVHSGCGLSWWCVGSTIKFYAFLLQAHNPW